MAENGGSTAPSSSRWAPEKVSLFLLILFGYLLLIFARFNLIYAIPSIVEESGLTKSHVGLFSSAFSVVYGVSRFLGGFLSDRFPLRHLFALSLIGAGICNLLFSWSHLFELYLFWWAMNGFLQGFGWPAIAKLVNNWYTAEERGIYWSGVSMGQTLGASLIGIGSSWVVVRFGWRAVMQWPALMCLGGSIIIYGWIRDEPNSGKESPQGPIPLTPTHRVTSVKRIKVEISSMPPSSPTRAGKKETVVVSPKAGKKEKTVPLIQQVLEKKVEPQKFSWLTTPIILLGLASALGHVIRVAFSEWSLLMLIEWRGLEPLEAGSVHAVFSMGATFGTITAGVLSDMFFKGRRLPVTIGFTCGTIAALLTFMFWMPTASVFQLPIMLGTVGFFLYGPSSLFGLMAMEMAPKHAAGSANGFAGVLGNIGAASAGLPFSWAIQRFGWSSFHGIVVTASILLLMTQLPLLRVRTRPASKAD